MKPDQLRQGDIILISRAFMDSAVSGIIKVGTLSKYSHAMLFCGNDLVVEAIADGVKIRSVALAVAGANLKTVFRHTAATPEQLQNLVQFAKEKEGGAFAIPGVLAGSGLVAFGMPASWPLIAGRSIVNAVTEKLDRKRSYFCAELVADAYRVAGLPLGIYGRTPSLMNPGDIGEYSDRNPETLSNLGSLD